MEGLNFAPKAGNAWSSWAEWEIGSARASNAQQDRPPPFLSEPAGLGNLQICWTPASWVGLYLGRSWLTWEAYRPTDA